MTKICKNCNKCYDDKYCCCAFCGKKIIPYDGSLKDKKIVTLKLIYDRLNEIEYSTKYSDTVFVLYAIGLGCLSIYYATKYDAIFIIASGILWTGIILGIFEKFFTKLFYPRFLEKNMSFKKLK